MADRLGRRRTALAAAEATLGVVVVVGGGLALGAAHPRRPARPPPRRPRLQTSIPAGFPLADDLEKPTSPEEELAGPGARRAGLLRAVRGVRPVGGPRAPEDSLAVRHTAPEWFDGRVLQVYADDAAARQVLFELVRLYEFCREDAIPGPPDTVAGATIRPCRKARTATS